MSRTGPIPLPRNDTIPLAAELHMFKAVLDRTDVSVTAALDKHFGFAGAVDLVLATAGPHALLTTTESTKAETTR
jgi:hypothetical protein